MALILASGSPRRRELMSLITPDYTVITSDVDETKIAADSPAHLAKALATAKARAVAEEHPDDIVCGFDTVVECSASRKTRPTPCGCCAPCRVVRTAYIPASASAGAAALPLRWRQHPSIFRPSRRTTCGFMSARRNPTIRPGPMPSRGTRRCGVRASKGATTTSWGCRSTARHNCCANFSKPAQP